MLSDPRAVMAALEDVWSSFLPLVQDLDDEAWATPTACPGWDVRDQVSHFIWGVRTQLAMEQPVVEVPELAHLRDDLGRYMEMAVHERRQKPPAELVAELEAIVDTARAAHRTYTDDDLAAEASGPMGMMVKRSSFLRIQVFDQWAHEQDVRRAVGRPGHLTGRVPEHARDSAAAGWARSWPDVAADAGGAVVVDIEGPSATRFGIDLGDRRPPLVGDELADTVAGGDVAATLTMPFEAFVALTCGRSVPDEEGRGAVSVEGDAALADRLLDRASVTP